MAPQVGNSQVAFGSTAFNRMDNITRAATGNLESLKRTFSRDNQLFVPNTAGNLIATGVSRTDLTRLQQVDVHQQGSMRLGSIDAARKILVASGLPQTHVDKLPAEQLVKLARSVAANGPHVQAWMSYLTSVATDYPNPTSLNGLLKTMDLSLSAAPPFATAALVKGALTGAGAALALVNALPPERALNLAKFAATGSPHVAAMIVLEQAVQNGNLDPKVVDRAIKIAEHNPALAGKVINYANQELAGAVTHPRGIAEYVSRIAVDDARLCDLRGYPRPAELPLPAALPFNAKMHVKLPQADYLSLRAEIQKHQAAYGSMNQVNFDDAACRIDFGYSMEELEAINRGKSPPFVPPPVGPDLSGGFNSLAKRIAHSADYEGDKAVIYRGFNTNDPDSYTKAHFSFASPQYVGERQDMRLNAIADAFRAFANFDYAAYDAAITPAVNQQIQGLAGNNAGLIDDILQTQNLPGFSISETHDQRQTKDFITQNMAQLFARNVRVIGLEHLNVEGIQADIDAFLDPAFVGAMPRELESKLRGLGPDTAKDSLVLLINAAKAHPPMQVISINGNNLRPTATLHNPDGLPIRDATMNALGKANLENRLQQAQVATPGAKFVLLVGGAHNKSHEGLFQRGIPGFPQMFNVPMFKVDPKPNGALNFPTTVIADDPTQRRPLAPGAAPMMSQYLGELSGKTGTISGRLSPELQTALDNRIYGSSPDEQTAIKDLLHFSWGKRGDTTQQSRLDIRTILAQGLAKGLPLDQLTCLRNELMAAPPGKLNGLITDFNNADMLTGVALSRNLLDMNSPTAKTTFANLRPLLTTGAADLAQANKPLYADQNIAMRRDALGNLEISSVDVAFVSMSVPPGNRNLTDARITELKDVFNRLASTPYSHQAVMLDFLQHFRTQRLITPGLTMSQAMATFIPDGAASMAKYGRGDCICQAEAIVAELAAMGITAHIAGVQNPGLTKQKFGEKNMVQTRLNHQFDIQPRGIANETGAVTHTEVLIPYTDENGHEKVLGFSTGGGPLAKFISSDDLTTTGMTGGVSQRLGTPMRLRVSPDGAGLNAQHIQKAQFGFRSVVHLVNTNPTVTDRAQKQSFAINLLEGTISISAPLAAALAQRVPDYAALPPQVGGDLTFNYRDALQDPGGLVNINLRDDVTGAIAPRQITKLQALHLFLRTVQITSNQGPEFLENVRTLLENEAAYCNQILLPDLGALSQNVLPNRTAALAHKPPLGDPRLPAWQALMQAAGVAINAGDQVLAASKFREASQPPF